MFDIIYHLSTSQLSEAVAIKCGELRVTDLAALGHTGNSAVIQEVVESVRKLHMTRADYLNVKMILLLNPCMWKNFGVLLSSIYWTRKFENPIQICVIST